MNFGGFILIEIDLCFFMKFPLLNRTTGLRVWRSAWVKQSNPYGLIVPSIAQGFYASAFLGTDKQLFTDALESSSVKSAKRICFENQGKWNQDFKTRSALILSGFLRYSLDQWPGSREEINRLIETLGEGKNIKILGLEGCAMFDSLNIALDDSWSGDSSLGVVLNTKDTQLIFEQLARACTESMPTRIVVMAKQKSSLEVDEWCWLRGIAVRHVCADSRLLDEKDIEEFVEVVDRAMLIGPTTSKVASQVQKMLSAEGKTLHLEEDKPKIRSIKQARVAKQGKRNTQNCLDLLA